MIRNQIEISKEFIAILSVEMSHAFLFYYKYTKSKSCLDKASLHLQTKFEFSG